MNDIFSYTAENQLAPDHTGYSLIQAVSHELRGTFGVISGLHSLLPLASGEAERADMFNRLQNNTEYATQLFSDLEDYCAMETGSDQVEEASFRPALALDKIQKKALPMLQRRKAVMTVSGDREMIVNGDEEKICRIVKSTIFYLTCVMRTRKVEIGCEKRSTAWALNVAHSGGPLPEWLFLPENEPHDPEIGRHVSLLLIRKLVAALGGSIHGGTPATDGRPRISFRFPH